MIPLRVLIIEDSESDAALTIRQLQKAGFSVSSLRVEDESQLRLALSSQAWELIIADYQLPEMNASKALEILQESGLDIPFIVISGAIGEETAVDLMKSGASDYLMKGNLARLGPAVERELVESRIRFEHKKAFEALKESEKYLQYSQKVAHVGHWVQNPQTHELKWSQELFQIFGLDPALSGEPLYHAWQQAILPDDRPFVLQARDNETDDAVLEEIEYRIIRTDGVERTLLSLAGTKNKDKNGRVIQQSGVVQDITERKQAELSLIEIVQESQKRAAELEAITAVSSSMRNAGTRSELVDIVLENLFQLLKADLATLAFVEASSLIFENVIGFLDTPEKFDVNINHPIFSQVIQTEKPIKIDFQELIQFHAYPEKIKRLFTFLKTGIIYPLISGHSTIGVILLGYKKDVELSHEQINLINAISEMSGNAINRMLATDKLEKLLQRREKELDHIYQITSAASKTLNINSALQDALELTLKAVNSQIGTIHLVNETDIDTDWIFPSGATPIVEDLFKLSFPSQLVNSILQEQKTILSSEEDKYFIINSAKTQHNPEAFICMPMRIQNRVIGILIVAKISKEEINIEELTLLSFIADQLALHVESAHLSKKAEIAAVHEERSRLARELHDSVTQSLYSANLYCAGAQRYAAQGSISEVNSYLSEISQLTQQALKDMRLLVYELRSSELTNNGLINAIQSRLDAVERRSSLCVEFNATELPKLPVQVEENLYRIVIEALNNSLKHAKASHLWIDITRTPNLITLAVRDDGCGFEENPFHLSGGIGLNSMKERTKLISGAFELESKLAEGTRIKVSIPINSMG